MINSTEVEELFIAASWNADTPALHIATDVMLNKQIVEDNREKIVEWINELHPNFLNTGGGGWSSLNLCMDKNEEQWTGLQMVTFQLFALASVIGLADFLLPRDMWSVLPGGMPYVVFRTEELSNA